MVNLPSHGLEGPVAQILIIDDNIDLLKAMRAVFSRRGHEVRTATDGRAGITLLKTFPADLVITDINMPEMDGIEVIMGLQEGLPDLPVVAMSGGGMVDKSSLLEDADILGAVHTLAKPFEIDELIERVEALLPDPE